MHELKYTILTQILLLIGSYLGQENEIPNNNNDHHVVGGDLQIVE